MLLVSCEKSSDEILPLEPEQKEYCTLLKDKLFKKGFFLSSTDEANPNVVGKLDYGGKVTQIPAWRIAQWNCINNDLSNAHYGYENDFHTYIVGDKGNRVAINDSDGTLILELNTSTEYGLNGITSNPREQNEPWPTLLCEYKIPESNIINVSEMEEIRMSIHYEILKLEDKMSPVTTNDALHSAQFQWFITVQNRNASSPEFGRYIWFGLNLHDKRYDYAPFYAAEDGGKDNNTGAFIYMPEMQTIMSDKGKAEVGKKFGVDIDILPIIKEAFKEAQQRNYFTKTNWDDLFIGATNLGWEVTGTYDVTVKIDNLDILYK